MTHTLADGEYAPYPPRTLKLAKRQEVEALYTQWALAERRMVRYLGGDFDLMDELENNERDLRDQLVDLVEEHELTYTRVDPRGPYWDLRTDEEKA